MSYTPIDLSTLPKPEVIVRLSYEAMLAQVIEYYKQIYPEHTAFVESDPVMKAFESATFVRLMDRQTTQDDAIGNMLAYASGANLENLAALYGVRRKLLSAGNPNASPPTADVYESDESLRYRTQLAPEGLSTAGPVGSYVYHALKVEGVKDVGVQGPPDTDPGDVLVTLLSDVGDGTADSNLIAAVNAALNDEDVRPLTDQVTVQSATIQEYEVIATLYVMPGPDPEIVRQTSLASVQAFVAAQHKVGADIRLSALYAALHVGGVDRVTLSAPGITSDLVCTAVEAPFCTDITLTTADA